MEEINKVIQGIPQNTTDMVNKSMEEMAKATSQLTECFLCEYCEVKGIKETELKKCLTAESTPNGSFAIKENGIALFRTILNGIKESEGKYTLNCDVYLLDKGRFPKTSQEIQKQNHSRNQ